MMNKIRGLKMRAALTSIVLITLLFFNSCENTLEPDEIRTVDGILFKLTTDKKEYYLPDTLNIKITITNFSGLRREFNFSSGCQLGFRILLPNNEINFPTVCPDVLTSITIENNETKEVSEDYFLGRFRGLIPGEYKLEAFLMNNNSPVLTSGIKFF
jgi:hypothetical protein